MVIRRPLGTTDGGATELQPGGEYQVTFAVWDGAERQPGRDADKSVTTWHRLRIAP